MSRPEPGSESPPDAAFEEARRQARQRLHSCLAARPRSVEEARQRLRRAGFDAATIDATIADAQDRGWLDDAAFARLWIEDRCRRNPKAPAVLVQELRAKGVDEALIRDAVAEADIDETALAREVIERHRARYRNDPPQARQRKLVGLLRRRGFSRSAIRKALRDASLA